MFATISRLKAILAIIAAVLLSSGCGGGGAAVSLIAEGVGSGGTGIGILKGIGVITGFGSVIVDGVRRDDSMATYMSEEDQGTAMAIAPTAAMLGHTVEFRYDGNSAMSSVLMSPELVGTVTAASATSLTVLGTAVTINSDPALGPVTVLVGYASPTEIQIGDRVVVYGVFKTDTQGVSTLQATLIGQKATGTGVRLTGYVSQYSSAASSFVIGSITVNIGSAAISPKGTPLANGQLVTLWSDSAPIGSVVTASAIRIKWPPTDGGERALSGVIAAYSGAAGFKVNNVAIDASNATIAPAGATLGERKYVVVIGQFDAAANKLTASSVTVYAPAAGSAVELHGTVLNYVSPSSFTVRGVVVDASNASFTGGSAADLANNVFVEVTGAVANNIVRATRITIVALNPMQAPADAMLDLDGTITSYDASTGGYILSLGSGATMRGMLRSSMFFSNGVAANFTIGQQVHIRGMFSGGTLSTSVVSFVQQAPAPGTGTMPGSGYGPGPGPAYMEGFAYDVTPTSFKVNGVTIQNNGVSVQGGGMMGNHMRSGARVGVTVQNVGGQYTATAINLLDD